jgi:protein tyrosine/serine phosphatase
MPLDSASLRRLAKWRKTTMQHSTITQVNIYRRNDEWCYSAWAWERQEFDHSDTVGCPDNATEDEARAELAAMFPAATITRVDA